MLYFAYGSNMLSARLRSRCPDAKLVGPAKLANHTVRFTKRGMDGSGKATLEPAPNTVAHGVLFDIPPADWPALDAAEGPAYARLGNTCVETSQGRQVCETYQAKSTEEGLPPFDWYLALILAGCHEHNLPSHVQAWYKAYPFRVDDQNRPTRRIALENLVEVGSLEWTELSLGIVFSIFE